jgi:hypothetical protein
MMLTASCLQAYPAKHLHLNTPMPNAQAQQEGTFCAGADFTTDPGEELH